MPKIFISYRRQDAPAAVGRIRDRLAAQFGENNVYMDIDSIPFGVDFAKHIDEALKSCDVMLVMIGRDWRGPRTALPDRILDEGDFVRIEVEAGLRHRLRTIPVLLDDALMPQQEHLPASLHSLLSRNAATISSGREFRHQCDRLIRSIEDLYPSSQVGQKIEAPAARSKPWVAIGAAAALGLAVTIFLSLNSVGNSGKSVGDAAQSSANDPLQTEFCRVLNQIVGEVRSGLPNTLKDRENGNDIGENSSFRLPGSTLCMVGYKDKIYSLACVMKDNSNSIELYRRRVQSCFPSWPQVKPPAKFNAEFNPNVDIMLGDGDETSVVASLDDKPGSILRGSIFVSVFRVVGQMQERMAKTKPP